MATILRSKAVKNVNKGNTSAYYSYVEERNGTNPVIQQLDKELQDYMGFVKKKNAGQLKPGEHPNCKVSDALFDIWNKFEPRVTRRFFYQKLMLIGEFLVQNKEYATASWQCYDRYLNHFASVNFDHIQTLADLKRTFFPENDENEDVTFRALMGHCICMFHFTIGQDPKLQTTNSTQQITDILRFLRLIMQMQLEKDHLCWLVYNATIYFYTISRYLMQFSGFSKILLEYLLFCCLAIENSIPLLGVKYLSWRSTLYVITCQCYYDCKYNDEGEIFARRALSKINELHELEMASINGEQGARSPQFREATIKIGATLFKRLVYESRRKNKGLLRQKYRLAYKDLNNQQWPRTAAEKLLNEMFDCSSAQFLAIEEALSDSNRRIAMPMPAGGESDFENLDVVLELLYAAEYIVNGGGGKAALLTSDLSDFKGLNLKNDTLIEMAIKCENGAKIRNFLKIVKYAYSYENWEIFRRLSNKTVAYLESSPDLAKTFQSDIYTINLLLASDKYLVHLRKIKNAKAEAIKQSIALATAKDRKSSAEESTKQTNKSAKSIKNDKDKSNESKSKKTSSSQPKASDAANESQKENQKENEENIESPPSPTPQETLKDEDFLSNIAFKLMLILDSKLQPEKTDLDIIVDITLMLWRKCKDIFQKYQTGSEDNYRWVTKLENFSKWLFILNVVHESMCYFDLSTIDPAVFAHCSLRLGLTYESLANINSRKFAKESSSMGETTDDQFSMSRTNNTKFTLFEMNDDINEKYGVSYDVRENLFKAQTILKKSTISISAARASISKTDKTFMCDKNYDETNQIFDPDVSTKMSTNSKKIEKLRNLKEKTFDPTNTSQVDSVSNLIADLHVELIFLYHKISMRLIEYKENSKFQKDVTFEKEFEILFNNCKKNRLSQSLLLMSKALYLSNYKIPTKSPEETRILVQKAYDKLLKVQDEDKALYYNHVKVDAKTLVKSKIPPAPVVCLRTQNKIVVEPRNFVSLDGIVPSWYRIFSTQITQVNAKARISDYSFQGCGEQIPANNCEKVAIRGLTPNEKYVFAVAAYDKNGNLIANSIGESTEPILASNTLSILMSYTYLCQVCYQIHDYNLSLKAFEMLWNHFVIKPVKLEAETYIEKNDVDYEVTFHQLNYSVIEITSPILLRKFVECFFIVADIETKMKKIYCDLLYDGKIQYHSQIERIRQCEKMLLCIDLASWLNDPQIILQAVVQIYGFLAPLIYYNLAYEPITQVLTHCLIVLEEVPNSILQKKSKNTFESLQHMIACTSYYLTDTLKRFNKKSMSNYFNLVGRKLLGLEESIPGREVSDDQPIHDDSKEEKNTHTKLNELKALEIYIAKTNASNKVSYFNMLTGNEDASQIYAFIAQNQTKLTFKELIKFRKRPNYFEYLTNLLHKGLTEELSVDINEWCLETLEWLQKRNISILGAQLAVIKKPDVVSVGGMMHAHGRKSINSETGMTTNETAVKDNLSVLNNQAKMNQAKLKKKIKKYKLLIPVDLDLNEKQKLEEKQKKAIDTIFDLFPEKYENWMRRSRLRRLFQEESAHKSQFYVIWALNNFAILMNRVNQSSPQSSMHFQQRLNSSSYLDSQQFLFDKNNALILPFDDLNDKHKPKRSTIKNPPAKRSKEHSLSPNKMASAIAPVEEKLHELRDTAEILADVISGIEYGTEDDRRNSSNYHSADSDHPKGPQHPISVTEFSDLANNIFSKFKRAVVISHRCKQWIQLQNICKLMLNCMNTILVALPAISFNNRKTFKLPDVFKALLPACYLASENLLDMIFFTCSIDKSREIQNNINKWYDSININKSGASLKFDIPLDDITSIDLRFVKEFIFRSIQCLCSFEKWEKLLSIALKFNAMTGYKFAENLSPIIVNAQHKILKQMENMGVNKTQPHFERLKAELGRYPKIEDLFFLNFKIVIDTTRLNKLETGVKIDPRAHDIYSEDNKSKELISVPLSKAQSIKNLSDSLDNSLYISRALIHSRRLLSLFLLSHSNEYEFFGVHVENEKHHAEKSTLDKSIIFDENKKIGSNEMFHSNPIDFKHKTFENDNEVFVKEINIELKTVIESYEKTIQLLLSNKEKDLVTQAMHELGNVYHYAKDINSAYRYWNEALDSLTVCRNTLINWRKEFSEKNKISTEKFLERCGIWGCLLGGVITSKMAQYYLTNDLELKTECCLLSAVFFKSIFSSSVPFSKHDLDFANGEVDHLCNEYLIPGLLFNSEMYRFDIRYVISALNFVCIELINAGHYLTTIPSISLYEYFARSLARDLSHTVLARILKIEAFVKLNMFSRAIININQLSRGERLPHFIDEKYRLMYSNSTKYTEFIWNDSKPIYDLNNLRSLEALLSLKLPYNLVKLYGPHLTCRFYLLLCKTYTQIATCLPCMPDLEKFEKSVLSSFHRTYSLLNPGSISAAKLAYSSGLNSGKKHSSDDNPDVVKVFSKPSSPFTLEFIKGCLLGTAKTIILKCLQAFFQDFPLLEKYCVSPNWQREFKYECNIILAYVSDQSQLGYLALQNIIEAMKELSVEEKTEVNKEKKSTGSISISKKNAPKVAETKQSKQIKKGAFHVFDQMSKDHLNSRLWLNARLLFIQCMFNQLNDAGKAKGNDENIIRDFGDLNYYCRKCLEEADKFYDTESKAYFLFIEAAIENIRGVSLQSCIDKLKQSTLNFMNCQQLSLNGLVNFLKASILKKDLTLALNMANIGQNSGIKLETTIGNSIEKLVQLQDMILDSLKTCSGETIEYYVDKKKAYFNNVMPGIVNIYNPLLHYLVHIKLRLGSILILRTSYEENKMVESNSSTDPVNTCQHALNVLCTGLELNKVICERSINLEIELSYRQAFCLKELFTKHKLGSLADVVDAFNYAITLLHTSTHNLNYIKNCYLELAILFVSIFDPTITNIRTNQSKENQRPSKVTLIKNKKLTPSMMKAMEAALTALNAALKSSNAIKEKMLLPGHKSIKEMKSIVTEASPQFVASDLLGYYVFAERKKKYRDEIEEEVLSLAPEFEPREVYKSYEEKIKALKDESDQSITWIHLLNYQSKMQNMNSMRNLNTLKNGKNKFKYSDFFTIGFTPIFKSTHFMTGRLHDIHSYMKTNLETYKNLCQAPEPIAEFFKILARKSVVTSTAAMKLNSSMKSLSENAKTFTGNLATELTNKSILDKEQEHSVESAQHIHSSKRKEQAKAEPVEWNELQLWPANFDFVPSLLKINDSTTADSFVEYLITFNWYKSLNVSEESLINNDDTLIALIAVKDSATHHKIKFACLSAQKVKEIHEKLAPLATIADTSLESNKPTSKNNENENKSEFLISLRECLNLIVKLFEKKLDQKKFPFELIPSNIMDLESMFNPAYGGFTNNESLKKFIFEMFIND